MSSSSKFAFVLFLSLLAVSLSAQLAPGSQLLAINEVPTKLEFTSATATAAPANAIAAFPGGNEELLASLYETVSYPEAALENAVEGTVVVRLHLDSNGKVAERKIIRGLGFGCDAVAMEAIASLPSWIPARKNGRNTASVVYVPLKFSLQ